MSWITNWKKNNKKSYSWKYIDRACKVIARECIDREPQPIKRIVAMSRGGLPPAVILANYMDIREVISVGVRSYETKTDGSLDIQPPVVYQDAWHSCPVIARGEPILLVDDISDKGTTFQYVIDKLRDSTSSVIQTASIFIKDRTQYRPDYFYTNLPDSQWVEFPWEQKKLTTTAPQAPAKPPLTYR